MKKFKVSNDVHVIKALCNFYVMLMHLMLFDAVLTSNTFGDFL